MTSLTRSRAQILMLRRLMKMLGWSVSTLTQSCSPSYTHKTTLKPHEKIKTYQLLGDVWTIKTILINKGKVHINLGLFKLCWTGVCMVFLLVQKVEVKKTFQGIYPIQLYAIFTYDQKHCIITIEKGIRIQYPYHFELPLGNSAFVTIWLEFVLLVRTIVQI